MKFNLRQTVELTKHTGEVTVVEIEGFRNHVKFDYPIYDVREVETRVGYPAGEPSLKAIRRHPTVK